MSMAKGRLAAVSSGVGVGVGGKGVAVGGMGVGVEGTGVDVGATGVGVGGTGVGVGGTGVAVGGMGVGLGGIGVRVGGRGVEVAVCPEGGVDVGADVGVVLATSASHATASSTTISPKATTFTRRLFKLLAPS